MPTAAPSSVFGVLRRFLDRLYAAAAIAAAVCLVLIGVVMLAQAVGRSFGILIRGADDITGWLCAAAAFLALGHTFRHGELVRVGLWVEGLGARRRRYAELFALGVALCATAYMLWAITDYVYGNWRDKYMTQGLLVIPEWLPQVSLVHHEQAHQEHDQDDEEDQARFERRHGYTVSEKSPAARRASS